MNDMPPCNCGHWHWPASDSVEDTSVAAALSFSSAGVIEAVVATPLAALPRHHSLAFHEAGHAVAGLIAGTKIGFATIEGAVPSVGYLRSGGGDRWHAMTALAGPAAEMLEHRLERRPYDHEWLPHFAAIRAGGPARCDHCLAASIAMRATGEASNCVAMRWLRRREEQTFRVLRMRPVWAAVRLLAAELREHGTLPGSRVGEVVASHVPEGLRAKIREEIENAG